MIPQDLEAVTAEIANVIFRSIDPAGDYIVIRDKCAAAFTTARLLAGLPANIVGHRDDANGRPIRDCGIYRVTDAGIGHNEVAVGWASLIHGGNTGTVKSGGDITLDEVWAAALAEVLARVEPTEEDQ